MQRISTIYSHLVPSQTLQSTSSNYTKIVVEYPLPAIMHIIMNSPKDLNCLSVVHIAELNQALTEANYSTEIKVIMISSKIDKIFCAGADIKLINELNDHLSPNLQSFKDFSLTLNLVTKPIISVVNGVAYGGGFELALGSDIILCSEESKFGLPEINLGLIPGLYGTQRLTRIVGKIVASKMIMTGEAISAAEAYNLGIVAKVYKKEDLNVKALELAKNLANKSSKALIAAKEAIVSADQYPLKLGGSTEWNLFVDLLSSTGKKEGVGAFIQKRKPDFSKIQL